MRKYLENFFEKYEFTKEDGGYLLSCYDKIQSNPYAKECFDKAMAMYDENINFDYDDMISLVDNAAKEIYIYEYTAELLIYIMFTRRLKKRYEEKGISDEIYDTTVKDLRYQMETAKKVKHIIGTESAPWNLGFFRMERFGIGRLQYEIIKFQMDYEKDGKVLTPDTLVLNVHIPASNQPLSTELVMESFKMAKEFYKDIIGEPFAFKCSSWLLYPEHEKMLNKSSNIYKFMKIFDYLGYGIKKNNGDLYRIFGTYEARPEYLPEETSLQKAYKKHLLAGGKTGYGIGVYIL